MQHLLTSVSVVGVRDLFAERLVKATPREVSGARTFARYVYQANVSLSFILELHNAGKDYRALFDYHDDLVILNASDHPTEGHSYQIKGKDGAKWTTKALTSRSGKGQKPRSIVGKMYWVVEAIGQDIKFASFVSNAHFEFTLPDGSKTSPDHANIRCADLSLGDKRLIREALDDDFETTRKFDHVPIFQFERTPIGVKGYDDQVRGRLSSDLEKAGEVLPVHAIHQSLVMEIVRRCSDSDVHLSVSSLFEKKSLSRADIESVFERARKRSRTILDDWPVVQNELQNASISVVNQIRLKTSAIRYLLHRQKGDAGATQFSNAASNARTAHAIAIQNATTLSEIADILRPHLLGSAHLLTPGDFEGALLTEAFSSV